MMAIDKENNNVELGNDKNKITEKSLDYDNFEADLVNVGLTPTSKT